MVPAVFRSMKAIVSQDFRKVAIGTFHGRRVSKETTGISLEEIKSTIFLFYLKIEISARISDSIKLSSFSLHRSLIL